MRKQYKRQLVGIPEGFNLSKPACDAGFSMHRQTNREKRETEVPRSMPSALSEIDYLRFLAAFLGAAFLAAGFLAPPDFAGALPEGGADIL